MAQARKVGLGYSTIKRAGDNGFVRRVTKGVYAIEGTPRSRWEPHIAAYLSHPAAVLSHNSAAAIHGFAFAGDYPIELTTQRSAGGPRRSTALVHRARYLSDDDITEKKGVRVTTPCRTLLDLAARLGPYRLEKTLDEGLVRRLWTPEDFQPVLGRAPRTQPGRGQLQALVDMRMETPLADSMLEVRAYKAMRRVVGMYGPFEAHYQLILDSRLFVLDAAWPSQRVCVEVIGRAHRVASRTAFESERRKLNTLMVHGWRVAHLTAGMSADDMVEAVSRLLRVAGAPPTSAAGV